MIKGSHHTEESKRKIRDGNRGKIVSEETRRKLSDASKGKKPSEESRRKMSDAHIGKKLSEETKRKIGDGNRGKKLSEETKRKISGARKGMKFSEEHRRNISRASMGRRSWNKGLPPEIQPRWLGGIGKLPYSFDFNEELKELVKKRDGYMCQFPDCGTDKDLAVHHIDYQKMNSDPKNLITLCRTHNTKVNSNREYWKEVFGGMYL